MAIATIPLERAPVLASHARAQGLAGPGGDGALDAGWQDYPPRRTAHPALALRTGAAQRPGQQGQVGRARPARGRRAPAMDRTAAAGAGLDYGRASDEVATEPRPARGCGHPGGIRRQDVDTGAR